MRKPWLLFLGLLIGHVATAQTLKVMSYNIHHGADVHDQDKLDSMALFIKASGADLVGFQEVDSMCKRTGYTDQLRRLAELTGMYYAFARHMPYEGGAYGQGMLSRYPISEVRNERITLLKKDGTKDSRALVSAVVALPGGKKVVFASVHLALDAESRMLQAKEVTAYLQSRHLPAILTGDFNATPEAPEVKQLEEQFTTTDKTRRYTFPAEKAVKTIDYILISKDHLKKVKSFSTFEGNVLSDHLPIMATVQLK